MTDSCDAGNELLGSTSGDFLLQVKNNLYSEYPFMMEYM